MYLSLENNAIFVADAHYNKKNPQFLDFLKKVEAKEIETTQLFLMGDMFDFISGESKYFIQINSEAIKLLNSLSKHIKIVYLEGNHDYNLKDLFPNIKVLKREEQPFVCEYKKQKISLAHGDNFTDWKYDLYCKVIRNTILLKFLNMLDFGYFISKKIESTLLKKNICHDFKNFEDVVKKRLNNYKSDIIIEGHFHQGKVFDIDEKKYINIPSLCCSNEYTRFEDGKFVKEKI